MPVILSSKVKKKKVAKSRNTWSVNSQHNHLIKFDTIAKQKYLVGVK
jgi:hypothetical protein